MSSSGAHLIGCSSDGIDAVVGAAPDAANRRFREDWAATGRTLNMGKSCLRFRTRDDVDIEIVARTATVIPVEKFLRIYERIKPAKS